MHHSLRVHLLHVGFKFLSHTRVYLIKMYSLKLLFEEYFEMIASLEDQVFRNLQIIVPQNKT
jgi:hypothetical protein